MHPNFIPSKDSNQWQTVNGIKLHSGCSIRYKITDKIIRHALDHITSSSGGSSIYDNDDAANGITTVFGLYNRNQPEESFIGFSKIRLPAFIELSIYRNSSDGETVFDNFIKPYNLTDFTFEVKEFVNGTQADVQKRVDFYINTSDPVVHEFNKLPESIENEYITTEYLYEKRMDTFFGPLAESVRYFKPVKAHIYVISNMVINKRYVICLPDFYESMPRLLSIITNPDVLRDIKELGIDSFNIIHHEEYIAKTPYDLMLRADFMKIKYAGIVGYNKKFAHEDSYQFMRKNVRTGVRGRFERKFFLTIQRQIFKKKFKDNDNDIDYTNVCGIVYQIKNKGTGERFIGQAYTSLYNVINDMYKTAIKGNVKYNKMVKALSEVPFDNFDIKVLVVKKADDVKTSLGGIVGNLIMKYNTVEAGYNIDNKTAVRARRYGSRQNNKI